MRTHAYLTAALVAAVSVYAQASDAGKVPALPSAAAPSFFTFVQVMAALVLVVAAIFGTAWLMKKLTPGQFGSAAQLRIVGGLMVGAKERVVVVELRDTWLVLGVTSSQVSTLHTLDKPDDLPSADDSSIPFAERLARALKPAKPTTPSVGENT